jgi:hypothetical protein
MDKNQTSEDIDKRGKTRALCGVMQNLVISILQVPLWRFYQTVFQSSTTQKNTDELDKPNRTV